MGNFKGSQDCESLRGELGRSFDIRWRIYRLRAGESPREKRANELLKIAKLW